MKLTRHNGRSGKNGAYNPKHNDRRFAVSHSEHIDEERAKQNIYWDCYQGFHFPKDQEQEKKIVYSFEQVERTFYFERYYDYCEAQHERNRKTGHSHRDRTTEDLRLDKKTCPEESLIQIGTMEQSVQPEVLARIAAEFFQEFDRRFGEHIHILDWSLHLDEATPHIHERHVFDCENRYGEIAPQQEKALEALGFDLPNPEKKPGKNNNRKITFDATCRTMLFEITERHGLHLDQEPSYGGRTYLEKQDYILMKQKEKMAVQEQQIESKEAELNELMIRIEDTESFVEDLSEVAYEKAVEVVTDKVVEETHNADFEVILQHRKKLVGDTTLSPGKKKYANQILGSLLKNFSGMTQSINGKLKKIFRSPEKKAEIKEPIKESFREQLKRSKLQADAYNAQRQAEQLKLPKKKQQNKEL